MLTRTLVMITNRSFDPNTLAPEDGDYRIVAAPRTLLSDLNKVMPYTHALEDINVSDFDILLIPDGLGNPERGSFAASAVDAVVHFIGSQKRIELICEESFNSV